MIGSGIPQLVKVVGDVSSPRQAGGPGETLAEFLQRAAQQFGSRPALLQRPRYRTQVWTYARLLDRSIRLADWLQRQGVEKGDRLLIWAPNSPWWVAAFFASARLGAIVVPLDEHSSLPFAEQVIAQTEPKLALLSRATGERWRFPVPAWQIKEIPSWLPTRADVPESDVASDDIVEIMFTSGTTGAPKGVMLTHRNILANVEAVNQILPSQPHFRLLSILPLSHMFEQTVGLLLPLRGGASVFYPASRQPTLLFRELREQQVTMLLAVPQVLQMFMAAIEREVKKQGQEETWRRLGRLAEHLPRWARCQIFRGVHQRLGGKLQFLVSGGASLDPDLIHRWELLGIPVLQGYGATEAGPVICGTTPGDRHPSSVGRALPGVSVKLAEDGEVLVSGPNVTPGYWRNPEATRVAFEGPWYRTGDLGELDERGYLYLRGRKKDLIVLASGQKVYPEDVERALKQVPGVRDAAVIALPSDPGPRVHAVLLLDTAEANPAAVVGLANARLAPHQQIRGFTVWTDADFPRTHTLKVRKADLLRAVLTQASQPSELPVPPALPPSTEAVLHRLVLEIAHISPVDLAPNATLESGLGLDSLGRVELMAAIEAELGVDLDETRVGPQTTLAELDLLVKERQTGRRPNPPAWPLSSLAQMARRVLQVPTFAGLELIAPLEVEGGEILAGVAPPVLFVANHTSHLDTLVLLKAVPGHWRRRVAVAAAADYFFTSAPLATLVQLVLNAFPFSRAGAVRPTVEHCARLLDRGWSILLYPEGTRSTTGQLGAFKSGIGLLAVELGIPVVPVGIDGAFQILPKGRRLPHRGLVSVRFGPALTFGENTPYADATATIEQAVRRCRISSSIH